MEQDYWAVSPIVSVVSFSTSQTGVYAYRHRARLLGSVVCWYRSGTDEKTIINVLGSRSSQQRQQLKLTFKTLFGRVRHFSICEQWQFEVSFLVRKKIIIIVRDILLGSVEVGYSEWTECMKMRKYCPSNDYDQYCCCYSAKVELCNRCCVSVCHAVVLSVCLSVSMITAKVISWFNWNWVLWLGDWAYQLQELVKLLMVIRS